MFFDTAASVSCLVVRHAKLFLRIATVGKQKNSK